MNQSHKERKRLHITGFLPYAVESVELQIKRLEKQYKKVKRDIDKYIFLNDLYEQNRNLFFNMVSKNLLAYLPIIYDPTIADACLQYSHNFKKPQGIYICTEQFDLDAIIDTFHPKLKFICITSGERILGLGDIGVNGTPIPIAKLQMYTLLANIDPIYLQPIFFDFGTNNAKLLNDPFYLGLKKKRQNVEPYLDLLLEKVSKRFPNICFHFEDWKGTDALYFLKKYQSKYCMFNDDIQGTGAVTLAGMLKATSLKELKNETVLIVGAGSAGLGIAKMVTEYAGSKIVMIDSKGLIYSGRKNVSVYKKEFEVDSGPQTTTNNEEHMLEVISAFKPRYLIGVSTVKGLFTPRILRLMARINARPVIFSLSNPTDHTECTAKDAYTYTNGTALFSAGIQFEPVEYKGVTYYPGQANNYYIYPSIVSAIHAKSKKITNEMFIKAAILLAKETENGLIYPPENKLRSITQKIASKLN